MKRGMLGRRVMYWISVAVGLALAIVPLPSWLDAARPDLALLMIQHDPAGCPHSHASSMRKRWGVGFHPFLGARVNECSP